MSYIRFSKVSRIYASGGEKIKALDGVSFEIEKGKFTLIWGPSGSGKSTTLNLLGGMDGVTSGCIYVEGKDISKFNSEQMTTYRRHDIGFVFQFYNLIPNLTAYENVDIACKLSKNPIRADAALKAVGLIHRRNNFPAQMSGGELQRVSIARALCKNPKIILCDEPTGALDSETGNNIFSLLQNMADRYQSTVVVVTHNALFGPAADRIIKLKDGHVQDIVDNYDRCSVNLLASDS